MHANTHMCFHPSCVLLHFPETYLDPNHCCHLPNRTRSTTLERGSSVCNRTLRVKQVRDKTHTNPQTVNMWQLQVRRAYTQQAHNCKYRGLSVCVQAWDCSGLCVSLPRDTTKDWLLAGLAMLPEQLPPLDLPEWCFSRLMEAAFSKWGTNVKKTLYYHLS